MKKFSRRNALKLGLAGGMFTMTGMAKSLSDTVGIPTPAEVEGPFYPVTEQRDKDADLTRIDGHTGQAKGQIIVVEGQIADINGHKIGQVSIDIWQANAAGKYNHPRDPNPAPHDPDFQGWAIIKSDTDGHYRFKTIKPGAYPATRSWTRPPHIHFKFSSTGHKPLITQMYFPDEPLNRNDLLLQDKTKQQQSAMTATRRENHENTTIFTYNIVMIPI